MQIRVACPECGKSFQIPERFAGREGECSKCQAVFHIPKRAERVPEKKRKAKPVDSSESGRTNSSSRSSAAQSRPAHDTSATQEIPVYSIEPSDEFEVPTEIPAAPPEPPTFDITDADLLPDEEDLDGDAQPLDLPAADYVGEDSSQEQPVVDTQRDDRRKLTIRRKVPREPDAVLSLKPRLTKLPTTNLLIFQNSRLLTFWTKKSPRTPQVP
jgi:hypothetical protein